MSDKRFENYINRDKLYGLLDRGTPSEAELNNVLNKAKKLKGLSLEDVALLLRITDKANIHKIMEVAKYAKEEIYGKRLVLFAPIYTGNVCVNNCLYCAFRRDNKEIVRKVLDMSEIRRETESLLKEGHKRILLICGESPQNGIDYICQAIRTTYAARYKNHSIRRINVELAPMSVEDFRKLKAEHIGTYVCFQETYDPVAYKIYHPAGTPKADYENRLLVMDRAMAGGIDDVGLGVLFGLADYRFEILAIMEHAAHLEKVFGCGPHTVSFPRIEPAQGVALTEKVPHPVSDDDFKKIIAIIRIAMPYTGIILSTRENDAIRNELINYGVSQISAGSRTNPGAYSEEKGTGSQFSLGDHRSLDEVISDMIDGGFIPSFCTGCYRKGRVGNDFMDLAKPGLIKQYCMPNGLFTFEEYLLDFAAENTRKKGFELLHKMTTDIPDCQLKTTVQTTLQKIENGERDLYL
ncbi:MAG: [FeFe] hydrogenase H-cluster radical SAM maturase HydG [Bacteroidales bacterium]|jgi:2-iminoacetate synthase|nr:[FeFe] hydrogenase H-cluster radical SAM maturase HydG [Bacteroidales bacterium]